jgi:DNA-binding IclR family transcriptional regulator
LGFFFIWEESDRSVQLDSYPGYGIHLHTTALGKAILAHKPEAEIETVISKRGLPERTPCTITDPQALFEELQQVRDRGYAADTNERIRGMSAYAAPIFDDAENVLAAISIAGPSRRLTEPDLREEYINRVREAANVIELNLEYS